MHELKDDQATQYEVLEDAVAAHPERCHRALGIKWGLEYGQLEKPGPRGTYPTAQKRKADNETESRRIKPRMTNSYEIETSIKSTDSSEVQVRTTAFMVGPDVRVPGQTTLEEVVRLHHVPEHHRMSEESAELRWGTDTETRIARHRVRAGAGLDPESSQS